MRQYLDLVRTIRDSGARKDDRTGTGTLSVPVPVRSSLRAPVLRIVLTRSRYCRIERA